MPNLLVPRPWTSQPQFATGINWANPITQGLVDAIDFSYAIPRSLILGTPAASFGTKPSLSVSNSARSMDTTAAFGGWYFTRSDGAYANAQCTHVAVANYVLQSGAYAGLFVVCDSAGSNNSFGVQYYNSTLEFVYPGGNTASIQVFGHGWGVVVAVATTTSTTLYRNGVPTGSTTNTPAAKAALAVPLEIPLEVALTAPFKVSWTL